MWLEVAFRKGQQVGVELVFASVAQAMGAAGVDLQHCILDQLGRGHPGWTKWFLATTVATSVTGFFFPFRGFTPPYAFAILSLVVLAGAIYALYARRLAGPWRQTYIICAAASLYLNFFVLIAQLFQRSPALHQLAPT